MKGKAVKRLAVLGVMATGYHKASGNGTEKQARGALELEHGKEIR